MEMKHYWSLQWAVQQAKTLKGLYEGEHKRQFEDYIRDAEEALEAVRQAINVSS